MKTAVIAIALGALGGTPAAAQDARAEAIIDRMFRAIGGTDALSQVESLAFTFAFEKDGQIGFSRRHTWYPQCGCHSVAGQDRDGTPFRIEWNLHSKKGTASKDGVAVTGEELDPLLERAWGLWVNDTYWLLMPYKLRDPGVHLAYDGEEERDGKLFDKIKVTFDQVGLTPGDTYWAFIARDSGLMERWAFVLQGREPPASEFQWSGFRRLGPLVLATRKADAKQGAVLYTTDLEVTMN